MRILVCGDRDWDDWNRICYVLGAALRPGDVVIHGACRGADDMARDFAKRRRNEAIAFHADWERFGKAAGPRRNSRMLAEGLPDVVIAFHDRIESSRGTKDMVSKAAKADLPVVLVQSSGLITLWHIPDKDRTPDWMGVLSERLAKLFA